MFEPATTQLQRFGNVSGGKAPGGAASREVCHRGYEGRRVNSLVLGAGSFKDFEPGGRLGKPQHNPLIGRSVDRIKGASGYETAVMEDNARGEAIPHFHANPAEVARRSRDNQSGVINFGSRQPAAEFGDHIVERLPQRVRTRQLNKARCPGEFAARPVLKNASELVEGKHLPVALEEVRDSECDGEQVRSKIRDQMNIEASLLRRGQDGVRGCSDREQIIHPPNGSGTQPQVRPTQNTGEAMVKRLTLTEMLNDPLEKLSVTE